MTPDLITLNIHHPWHGTHWHDKVSWLISQRGQIGVGWDYHQGQFYFRTEGDRVLFQLAWPD
jgi:hypothetical protein